MLVILEALAVSHALSLPFVPEGPDASLVKNLGCLLAGCLNLSFEVYKALLI